MLISLIFYEKPKSPNKQMAIELLTNLPHEFKEGKYFINTDIINPEIKKIIKLSCSWKTTELFFNQKQINLEVLQDVLYCRDYGCYGVCRKFFGNYFSAIKTKDYHFHPNFFKMCPFLKNTVNSEFHVDVELFTRYLAECNEILQFCDKFNAELTYEEFKKLPEHFQFNESSPYASEVDRGDEGHPGSTPIKMREISRSNVTIQYAINNGIIFTFSSKSGGEEIIFKIRLLGFNKVNLLDIDRIDKVESFEKNGVLFLLKCEIINLSKRNIHITEINDILRIIDGDNFQFTIFLDYFLNENTKFGENFGLKGTTTATFRPKIKKAMTLAIFLPDEENQKYYLGVKGGALEEI